MKRYWGNVFEETRRYEIYCKSEGLVLDSSMNSLFFVIREKVEFMGINLNRLIWW